MVAIKTRFDGKKIVVPADFRGAPAGDVIVIFQDLSPEQVERQLWLKAQDVAAAGRFLANTLEREIIVFARECGRSARIPQLGFAFEDPLYRRDPSLIAGRTVQYKTLLIRWNEAYGSFYQ